MITAIGAGTATITAESQDGSNAKASCIITVTKHTQQFTGTQSYSKKYGDADFTLDAELTDGDGMLSYVSSNNEVAIVSDTGKVTLKGGGETTVTITAAETDDFKLAQFKVTIKVAGDNVPEPTGKPNVTTSPKPTGNTNVIQPPKPTNIPGTVQPPLASTVLKDSASGMSYKVLVQGNSVAFCSVFSKVITKAAVPDTVTIDGINYKVTEISNNAFSGCKKLKSVTIGKYVTKIGDNAFNNCISLKKVVIPASVVKIGKKAFYGCKKLNSIIIKTQKLKSKSVGSQAFKGIHKKATVKVPGKQRKAYLKWLRKKGVAKTVKIK